MGEFTCVAAEFVVAPGQPLLGLRWYNNDGDVAFPGVFLLEGETSGIPDLADASLVLDELSAESSSSDDVQFETPVSSSTGTVFAVCVLPSSAEVTGTGIGTGPGIGVTKDKTAPRILMSEGGSDKERSRQECTTFEGVVYATSSTKSARLVDTRSCV